MTIVYFLLVIGFLFFIFIRKATLIIEDNHCVVAFRLGKFRRTFGPGKHYVMPLVNQVVIIDLVKELPTWRSYSPEERDEKLLAIALKKQGTGTR